MGAQNTRQHKFEQIYTCIYLCITVDKMPPIIEACDSLAYVTVSEDQEVLITDVRSRASFSEYTQILSSFPTGMFHYYMIHTKPIQYTVRPVFFFFFFFFFLISDFLEKMVRGGKKKKETDFYMLLWRLCSCHGYLYGLPRRQCRQVSVSSLP